MKKIFSLFFITLLTSSSIFSMNLKKDTIITIDRENKRVINVRKETEEKTRKYLERRKKKREEEIQKKIKICHSKKRRLIFMSKIQNLDQDPIIESKEKIEDCIICYARYNKEISGCKIIKTTLANCKIKNCSLDNCTVKRSNMSDSTIEACKIDEKTMLNSDIPSCKFIGDKNIFFVEEEAEV